MSNSGVSTHRDTLARGSIWVPNAHVRPVEGGNTVHERKRSATSRCSCAKEYSRSQILRWRSPSVDSARRRPGLDEALVGFGRFAARLAAPPLCCSRPPSLSKKQVRCDVELQRKDTLTRPRRGSDVRAIPRGLRRRPASGSLPRCFRPSGPSPLKKMVSGEVKSQCEHR